MLKDDVKKDLRIKIKKKKKKRKTTNKTQIGQKERSNALSAHFVFFNNTIDITLPSPNKARDT